MAVSICATIGACSQEAVALVVEITQRVREKAEDIEGGRGLRKLLGAVTEVMFEIVAFGLEGVDIFVFYLPSGSPGSTDGSDGFPAKLVVGN